LFLLLSIFGFPPQKSKVVLVLISFCFAYDDLMPQKCGGTSFTQIKRGAPTMKERLSD